MRHNKFAHTDEERGIYKCDTCNYQSTRKSNFERHMASRIDSFGDFNNSCEICGENFCFKRDLTSHLIKSHDQLKCEDCGQIFADVETKKMHCALKKVSPCQICNKSFCNAKSLASHRIHAHEHTKCDLCGAEGILLYHLKAHMKDVHQIKETFECHQCGSTFSSRSNFLNHIKSVHSTAELKCGTCNKVFTNGDSLRRHVKHEHSEVAPVFKCDYCKYNSPRKSNFDRHSKSRIKNFCEICQEYFCKRNELILHKTKNHSKNA